MHFELPSFRTLLLLRTGALLPFTPTAVNSITSLISTITSIVSGILRPDSSFPVTNNLVLIASTPFLNHQKFRLQRLPGALLHRQQDRLHTGLHPPQNTLNPQLLRSICRILTSSQNRSSTTLLTLRLPSGFLPLLSLEHHLCSLHHLLQAPHLST